MANVTVDDPEFTIGSLAPGFDYTVKVFAFNSRGKSEPYILDGFSLKVAENRMGESNCSFCQILIDAIFTSYCYKSALIMLLTFFSQYIFGQH